MEKNTGIEYELLVKHIFEQILNLNIPNIKTLKIEHDVILQGITGKHQIDVYWEFEFSGIKYKTIVQAKDWLSRVPQEKILAFNQILQDLPGQPRGIFITKTGYQKGAKEIADKHNILLYELREPTDKDWNNRIKNIFLTITLVLPKIIKIEPDFDTDYLQTNYPNETNLTFSAPIPHIKISDSTNDEISTLSDFINQLLNHEIKQKPNVYNKELKIIKNLGNDCYFYFPNGMKVKANSITITYLLLQSKYNIKFDGSDVVKYILKNITEKTEQRISPDLKLLDKEPFKSK